VKPKLMKRMSERYISSDQHRILIVQTLQFTVQKPQKML
jgi:hypothetical protein